MEAVAWADPLWTVEYEKGKDYEFKITYLDGHIEYGRLRYVGPERNPIALPNGEHLIIPKFESIKPHVTEGLVDKCERVA